MSISKCYFKHKVTTNRLLFPPQQAEALDSRVRVLSEQLENQMELQRESNRRAKQAEADLMDVQARLRSAEGELAAGDVLRDGFKTDKEMVRITNSFLIGQDKGLSVNENKKP